MTLRRLEHTGNAVATVLASNITAASTTVTVGSGNGYPTGAVGAFVIGVDTDLSNEEKILCSSRSSNIFTVAPSGRGYDGTVAGPHNQNAVVKHLWTAIEADDQNDHVYTVGRDDHTQYYNQPRHDSHMHPASVLPTITRSMVDPTLALPIGAIVMHGLASAPNAGWLYCDGSAVSRTTYGALFGVIGTTYGAGDGSTTFALPDLRSRTPLGAGAAAGAGLTARALAASGGEETHLLAQTEMPGHVHSITDVSHNHTVTNPTHTHSTSDPGHAHTLNEAPHAHGAPAGATTGYGIDVPSSSLYAAGSGPRPITFSLQTPAVATGVWASGSGTGISQPSATAQSTSLATAVTGLSGVNSTGGGGAHNVMQPWIALGYIIKAT
jgi:microcystin-dependent protein